MKKVNKASRDNRANQLNPNNIQYYKSRVDMSKSNSYMPKRNGTKKVNLPKGTYRFKKKAVTNENILESLHSPYIVIKKDVKCKNIFVSGSHTFKFLIQKNNINNDSNDAIKSTKSYLIDIIYVPFFYSVKKQCELFRTKADSSQKRYFIDCKEIYSYQDAISIINAWVDRYVDILRNVSSVTINGDLFVSSRYKPMKFDY